MMCLQLHRHYNAKVLRKKLACRQISREVICFSFLFLSSGRVSGQMVPKGGDETCLYWKRPFVFPTRTCSMHCSQSPAVISLSFSLALISPSFHSVSASCLVLAVCMPDQSAEKRLSVLLQCSVHHSESRTRYRGEAAAFFKMMVFFSPFCRTVVVFQCRSLHCFDLNVKH